MNAPVTSVVQAFWLTTCGFDTHHFGSNYAQHETPWNHLSGNGILVATVWEDEIVDVVTASGTRRFIILGGKMGAWKGPAIRHGREAEINLDTALEQRRRIVGYEAEPAVVDGTRRVKRFHMDRFHELVPVFARNPLIEQLDLYAQLQAKNPELATAQRLGTVFELYSLVGPPPSPEAPPPISGSPGGEHDDPVTVARMSDAALPLLVRHVRAQYDGVMPVMTYAQLAEAIGWLDKNARPHARGVGAVLKEVMQRVDAAGAALGSTPPLLTAVVVAASGANEGLPEAGIDSRWPGYAHLLPEEKRARVLLEYDRIIAYGAAWDALLTHLGVAPPPNFGRGGGESPAHRALKEYVLAHPHEFGIGFGAEGSAEYALKSGDAIDVFFKTHKHWTGIEVKSRISDAADIERGIYQVIKYRAVLSAQAAEHKSRPTVRVALVMEGTLPDQFKALALRLNVEVLDGRRPE